MDVEHGRSSQCSLLTDLRAAKDRGILEEPIRRFTLLKSGAQCLRLYDRVAEARPLKLFDPVVERLHIDVTYSLLPRLSGGEDHERPKAGHEVNEAVRKA